MTRKQRSNPPKCEKISINDDGTAILGCRGVDGEPIVVCENNDYRDCTLPLGEFLCTRMVGGHEPHMRDPYKLTYVKVCRDLDAILSDEYKAGSDKNLQQRFRVMDQELGQMIDDPQLAEGDKGRYLYHIDARTLRAFLPAFYIRARDGVDAEVPEEVIDAVYGDVIAILEDYDEIYNGVATQVALRRTETEILALLLRGKRADYFPYPAVFREEAGPVHERNHDAYVIVNNQKIRIQITNTDYKLPKTGKRKSQSYDDTVVAIHQHIVNLDNRSGTTIITPVSKRPQRIDHAHDIAEDVHYPYAEYDPSESRFVAWGAVRPWHDDDTYDSDFEYIQQLAGSERSGVVGNLIAEARGGPLGIDEVNLLNAATHYLYALIREKAHELAKKTGSI